MDHEYYDAVQLEVKSLMLQDQFSQTLANEAEEPLGLQILEFYVSSYLRYNADHLKIAGKKTLRRCCKKLKALIDAQIILVDIQGDNKLLSFKNEQNLEQSETSKRYHQTRMLPKSFKSLDLLCKTFPNLQALRLIHPTQKLFGDNLPQSLGQLTCLTELNLISGPNIDLVLPDTFSQLRALKELTFEGPLNSISPVRHCTSLSMLVLYMRLTKVDDFPHFIGGLASLDAMCLCARGPFHCSLPENIGNLKKLEYLKIDFVHIKSLPKSLGDLSCLISLEIDVLRGLKRLPNSLGKLTGLQQLAVNSCPELEALPDSFCNLKNLTYLEFSHCHSLFKLPSNIGNLKRLECLKLDLCCSLRTVPDSLGDLKSLDSFRLFRCHNITTLPDSLTKLTSLRLFKMYPRLDLLPNINTLERHFYEVMSHCGCECGDFSDHEDESEPNSESEYDDESGLED